MVCTHNAVIFSRKKGDTLKTHYYTEESQNNFAEWK